MCYAILLDHLPCLVLFNQGLEELHSSCVLSCLCHPAACDLVQGLCFCPTRSSSSAVYPQDRSPSFTEEFIYFVFVPVLCLCSTDCLCLLFIKSHSELTFAPGSSVSSDMYCILCLFYKYWNIRLLLLQ